MEDINNYSESYPYGFEFDLGEETAFYHGESQVQYNEAVSVPSFDNSYAKETSSSVIEQGQLMDLNDLIKKIEKLRLEEIALTHRKNNGLVLLTEFSEKGLISSQTEFSTTAETPSELRAVYENLLWKFKETKESWFRKEKNLKEEIKLKTEYLESMREKCSNLAINQDELELSAGLKMVHPKTGKKLDRDINLCRSFTLYYQFYFIHLPPPYLSTCTSESLAIIADQPVQPWSFSSFFDYPLESTTGS
ncbi:Hypothetical protein CINCED_3A007059 [Cinara cedri]|uniref:Uncharacterized protein n=1 Tax=Cinara cedri TaxID=506608 RepID=A0A5E4N7S6_9HEMI|nr:Hypothetical protein CINCED_3A007059 [Cinara cedri]